jgi:hypothetical protein
VNGQFQTLFTKLTTLHKKNSFSFAIIAGNLFGDDDDAVSDLLAERISVPLPTYFTIGSNPLPQRAADKLSRHEDVSLGFIIK